MAHEPSSPRTSRPVRVLALVLATSFLAPLAVAREAPKAVPELRVGAARVDATWYVGSPAGQYASWGTAVHTDPPLQVDEHMVEPTAPANPPELTGRQVYVDPDPHATRRQPSYGVESRSDVRALVMESGTKRFAVVSADLYLPQQLLWSRIATILEERDRSVAAGGTPGPLTRISQENLALTVSHSHTSPYLSTPSWGVWTFQDVFDLRFFEWYAQKAAAAVVAAVSRLEPARVGAHRVSLGVLQRNSMGPAVADDGSPAGYPPGHNDISLDVIAFSGRRDTPIATWVVFGLHPEMLEGNDLLSGEYVHAMATIVDRALGNGHVTLFSQSNVGSSEPARGGILPPEARAEYSHRDYAQMRRAAAILASAVLQARADLAAGNGRVPFRSAVDLAYRTEWYAPPGIRAVPTVSNCRSDRTLDADPPIPLVGLPDCVYPSQEVGAPGHPGPSIPASPCGHYGRPGSRFRTTSASRRSPVWRRHRPCRSRPSAWEPWR